MTIYSQRDIAWKSLLMGSGNIGNYGCLITCIGMLCNLTPKEVNEKIKSVKGYEGNMVIWGKLSTAIPGLSFIKRVKSYNNSDVLANLPCAVEVDGSPIGGDKHWVLYIGNKKMLDPWTGTERPTSAYTPVGYAVMKFDIQGNSGDTINNMEKLPKDSVVRDILNGLNGKTSDDEVQAYIGSNKNIYEIVVDNCNGNENFNGTWIKPAVDKATKPLNEKITILEKKIEELEASPSTTPEDSSSEPTDDSTPTTPETNTEPTIFQVLGRWFAKIWDYVIKK